MRVRIDISPGELVDRLTILEIKAQRIEEPEKLANVRAELDLLRAARDAAIAPSARLEGLTAALQRTNEALWDVEDELREHERRQVFDARFVELARSVYRLNDRRSAEKRQINELLGSLLVEEKSYRPY